MEDINTRSTLLLTSEGIEKLKNSHVAVFGIGGVGCHSVEALARASVGALTLFDGDVFTPSNLNRQLYATTDTLGEKKVDVAKQRVLQINSACQVTACDLFVTPNNVNTIDFSKFDYVIDAIDDVACKVEIIKLAVKYGINIISCMGTGNKLNPMGFKVSNIKNTKVCPLAKVMRRLLKDVDTQNVKVVYSEEEPIKCVINGKNVTGSVSFVPPVAGIILASETIKDLIK